MYIQVFFQPKHSNYMTLKRHTQNITEHIVLANLIFHPSQTQGSPSLMKLHSETHQIDKIKLAYKFP